MHSAVGLISFLSPDEPERGSLTRLMISLLASGRPVSGQVTVDEQVSSMLTNILGADHGQVNVTSQST